VSALPPHVRLLDTFPIARYLPAFDLALASAGYNTFHENLSAGLPTLFVANDHPEQDEQWLRADFAALRGLALSARADDIHAIRRGVETLLRPETRARLTAACAQARPVNGAAATARYLEGLALTRKASPLDFRAVPPEVTG
jgi:UDP:flavonoid glycosyltransferase YjiC (YdhE family)